MPKRRFASSILLLNRIGEWTGLDLEYGNIIPAPSFHGAYDAVYEAVLLALENDLKPPKPSSNWSYPAIYRMALKSGRPGPLRDARNCLGTHIAVPVLFAWEGNATAWSGRTHVAYVVRQTLAAV